MASQKVAVVTGSNKGIGFAIVKALAKDYKGVVYLTARNTELGLQAIAELEKQGLKANFHQLDIDNVKSIQTLAKYLKEKYGGLDLLVNNAAIAYKAADTTPFKDQASHTIRVNFTATLDMCNAMFPLLRPHARVVNVASRAGMLKFCKDQSLRDKLNSPTTTVEDIVKIMNNFVEAAQKGEHESISTSAYSFSKVGLIALTKAHQRQFDKDSRADLVINACCPGYVDTDMSSHKGSLTPEQGALTPVHLSLLPDNVSAPKGDFWADKAPMDWTDMNWSWQ